MSIGEKIFDLFEVIWAGLRTALWYVLTAILGFAAVFSLILGVIFGVTDLVLWLKSGLWGGSYEWISRLEVFKIHTEWVMIDRFLNWFISSWYGLLLLGVVAIFFGSLSVTLLGEAYNDLRVQIKDIKFLS